MLPLITVTPRSEILFFTAYLRLKPHLTLTTRCPVLTYASVVHPGVAGPAQGLLHLPLQGDGGLGRSHVRHGLVGFGLQGQQSRADLLRQRARLGAVAFPPETVTDTKLYLLILSMKPAKWSRSNPSLTITRKGNITLED